MEKDLVLHENDKPKISVIVPVYNAENYLRECLDSLINQTYKNIEILCINDGSSDCSYTILQEYEQKDNRILVFSQENSGPAMARNVGLANANGEYLMFCDADDSYEPAMCEEMVNVIHSSDYDFVMCDSNIIETDKETRSEYAVEYNKNYLFGEIQLDANYKTAVSTLLWNKIFRMSLIRRYDITFPCGYEMDDDAFIFQYLAISEKAFGLKKKLYNYKLTAAGIVANYYNNKNTKKIFDAVYVFKYIIKHLINQNLFTAENRNWLIKRIDYKLQWGFQLLDKKNSTVYASMIKQVLHYFEKEEFSDYPLLTFCDKKKYIEAYYLYNKIKYNNYLGLITIKKSETKDLISLLGIEIFKKTKKPTVNKYYIFGIKYYEKQKIDIQQILDSLCDIKGYMGYLSKGISGYTSRVVSTALLHQKTFRGYKNKYNGKDIVLVGGGPTVNNFAPLKDVIYVGLNRAFLRKDIKFDYLFAADKIGIEKFIPEMIEYSKNTKLFLGDINCGKDFQISESVVLKLNAQKYNTDNPRFNRKWKFALDIETQPLGAFHSVAFQAMQFILYTNPKRIYLVGIDCGNAGRHFGGVEHNVADRGEDIEDLQQTQICEWNQLQEFVEMYYPETEIISVNPVGLKYVFKDVYTKSYLEEHPEINPARVKVLEEF